MAFYNEEKLYIETDALGASLGAREWWYSVRKE